MRRDTAFNALVVSVLFAAVCAYVLAHFSAGGGSDAYTPDAEAQRTVSAQGTRIMLTGIAVRRESVAAGFSSAAAWTAEDGTRLPAGTAAAVFASGEAFYTSRSAVFCADADGYEYLSPPAAEDFSVETVKALLASEPREYPGAACRLVEGFEWYYAALAESGGAEALECGEYELSFDGADAAPVEARLIAVDRSGDKTALLFRITAQDTALLHLRFCSAALTLRGE